jgi:hypothetical protein
MLYLCMFNIHRLIDWVCCMITPIERVMFNSTKAPRACSL